MQIDISGKTALVTGSTGGIGRAIAVGLVAAGARVIVNGRGPDRVDAAVARIKKDRPDADVRGVAADVASAQGCDALVASQPAVDILVNNVGVFGPEDFYKISDDTWQRFFDANVMAGVRLARAYTPGMVEAGWGRVVFISSESGLNIPPDMLHYGMTKTANLSFSRGLAKRLAGTGVTVNAVLPGPTLSEGVAGMLAKQQDGTDKSIAQEATAFVKAERPSSIIQRAASVEEVANMVVYVASPLSSATTGAALRVDGGVVDTIA